VAVIEEITKRIERTGYVGPISSKLNKVSPEKQKQTEHIGLKTCTMSSVSAHGLKRLSNMFWTTMVLEQQAWME
jgi:hypothetical protein